MKVEFNEAAFVESWNQCADVCLTLATIKGFWDEDALNTDTVKIMLIVTELAEGVEALRHGNKMSEHIPQFTGIEEEIADAVIRIMDLSQKRNWLIPQAIMAKLAFNAGREHKHGKEF